MLRLFYVVYETIMEKNTVFFFWNVCYSMFVGGVHNMRTNIVLNDKLLKKAFKVTKAKTIKDLVHEALEELIAVRQRLDIRDLRGRIEFREDYDHKPLRKGRAVVLVDTDTQRPPCRNHLAFHGNLYYSLFVTVEGRCRQRDMRSKKMIKNF